MSAGELLIGGATLGLAVATVWLAIEARKARTNATIADRRRLLRSAVAEQLDNLRQWQGANPAHGDPALERLRRSEPKLDAAEQLVDQMDLPADLAVFLVWQLGRIREEWMWWTTVIAVGPSSDDSPAAHSSNSGVGAWARMIDRLQVLAVLMAAEASARGFQEIRQMHDAAPWIVVLEGPDRERELRWATDRAHLGAPPFPANQRFAFAAPEARDRAGQATGARQRAALSR